MSVTVFPIHAEEYRSGRYITNTITFIPYSGFGSTSIAHFNNALWLWNDASGRNLMNRSPTLRHNATWYDTSINATDDGNSYIYACNTGSFNYCAQDRLFPISGTGNVTSADINLNMHYSWANSAQTGKYDVWTIFLRESGYVAGLTTASSSSSVMYFPPPYGSTKRNLSNADKVQIKKVYPSTTSNYSSTENNSFEEKNTLRIGGTLAYFSQERLTDSANLIVKATFIGKSDPFEITAYDGGKSIFTDYYFDIEDTFLGASKTGKRITIRLEGGEINGFRVIEQNNPVFDEKESVILFLFQPNMGGGYNVKESNYYYIVGLNQGVYYNSKSGSDLKKEEKYNDVYGNTLKISDLKIAANKSERKTFEEKTKLGTTYTLETFRDDVLSTSFKKGIQENYQGEIINKKAYQQLLESMDQYATINK